MFSKKGLLTFRGWAQESLDALLGHVSALPSEVLLRPVESLGGTRLRDQLVHMASAEAFWVTSAQGGSLQDWPYREAGDAEAIQEAFHRAFDATRGFLEKLDDRELSVPKRIVFPGGGTIDISPALMVHHIVTHHFHHKGVVAAVCRMLGHPAPETDLDAVVAGD